MDAFKDPVGYRIVSYRERNRNLAAMGFNSYAEYLRSDLWNSIRARVLEQKPTCRACGADATEVHHQKYRKKDLEGRNLAFLVPLCRRCHHRIEFRDIDGEKLNVKQANVKLRQISGE